MLITKMFLIFFVVVVILLIGLKKIHTHTV